MSKKISFFLVLVFVTNFAFTNLNDSKISFYDSKLLKISLK